jgi:RNA polymerase sigma-70 factor (ECF subfamily)
VVDDVKLLLAYERGDASAFKTLYEKYRNEAFFFALSLSGDAHAAEDAVQDAFISLMRNAKAARGFAGGLKSYVFRSVRWRVIDAIRKSRVRRESAAENVPALFDSKSAVAEYAPDVAAALMALPDEQRETVVLKIWGGMSFREISEVTGSSPDTAASRYRYAVEKLRGRLLSYING